MDCAKLAASCSWRDQSWYNVVLCLYKIMRIIIIIIIYNSSNVI